MPRMNFKALKNIEGQPANFDVLELDFLNALTPFMEASKSHEIFFTGEYAANIVNSRALQNYTAIVFENTFPGKSLDADQKLIATAETAIQVFLGQQNLHKQLKNIAASLAERRLEAENPDELEATMREEINKVDITSQIAIDGYLGLYREAIKELEITMEIARISESGLGQEEKDGQIGNLLQDSPALEDDIDALSTMDADPKLRAALEAAATRLPNMEQALAVLEARLEDEKMGRIEETVREFRERMAKYAEAAERAIELQKERVGRRDREERDLTQLRQDLLASVQETLERVVSGEFGSADDIELSTIGSATLKHMGMLLNRDTLWERYHDRISASMGEKLLAVSTPFPTPQQFQETVDHPDFLKNMAENTSLVGRFYDELTGQINLGEATERIREDLIQFSLTNNSDAYSVELVEQHMADLTWGDFSLSAVSTAALPSSLKNQFNQLKKQRLALNFDIGSVDPSILGPSYHEAYETFLVTYSIWGMDTKYEQSKPVLENIWVEQWKPVFEQNFLDDQIAEFRALPLDQRNTVTISTIQGRIQNYLEEEYELTYLDYPTVVDRMCAKWMEMPGSNFDSLEKSSRAKQILERVNDISSLTVALGSMQQTSEKISQNQGNWEEWGQFFQVVGQAWDSFKNIAEGIGGVLTGVGVALEIPSAFIKTTKYRKYRGQEASALEGWKKVSGFGAFFIDFDEIRFQGPIYTDMEAYNELYEKYGTIATENPTTEAQIQAAFHAEKYQYACNKLWRKYLEKVADMVGKISSYLSLLLTLIPSGVTQVIAGGIAAANAVVTVLRMGYRAGRKLWKKFWGTLGQEREAVGRMVVADFFEPLENGLLAGEMKEDAVNMMWKAGVYRSDDVERHLNNGFHRQEADGSVVFAGDMPAVQSAQELQDRLEFIYENRHIEDGRYHTLRMLLVQYMKESLHI